MMEKVIEINLVEEEDLYEKYNRNIISKELINYMIRMSNTFSKKETIKIMIHNVKKGKNIEAKIKDKLLEEYEMCLKEYKHNNLIQFIYLLIGIGLLFLYALVSRGTVIKEILLIAGWVVIWDTIEIEMFTDSQNKKRRKILKKLITSEIIIH